MFRFYYTFDILKIDVILEFIVYIYILMLLNL